MVETASCVGGMALYEGERLFSAGNHVAPWKLGQTKAQGEPQAGECHLGLGEFDFGGSCVSYMKHTHNTYYSADTYNVPQMLKY